MLDTTEHAVASMRIFPLPHERVSISRHHVNALLNRRYRFNMEQDGFNWAQCRQDHVMAPCKWLILHGAIAQWNPSHLNRDTTTLSLVNLDIERDGFCWAQCSRDHVMAPFKWLIHHGAIAVPSETRLVKRLSFLSNFLSKL